MRRSCPQYLLTPPPTLFLSPDRRQTASENPSQAALTTTGALSASGGGTSGLGTSGFSTIADTTASSSIADPSYYSYYSGTLSASGSAYYTES